MSNTIQEQPYSKNNLTDKDKALYQQLFINREDVYAVQTADGRYLLKESPLTQEILFSDQTIGTYQLDRKSYVINACLDFDLKKSIHEQKESMPEAEWLELLEKIHQYTQSAFRFIRTLGIPCYLEFSGFKGYHIWFFLDKPMSAAEVRKWLQHLEKLLPAMPEGIGIELFPKQDAIRDGGYGNFVKLPLQMHLKSGKHTHFLDNEFKPIPGIPEIIRTSLVTLPELPEALNTSTKHVEAVQKSSKSIRTPEMPAQRLSAIEKHCGYMQKLCDRIDREHHLDHAERIWLANILRMFGHDVVHQYFSKLSDYDESYTNEQFASLDGKPSRCDSSPDCAEKKCPVMERLQKQSPIVFANRTLTREDVDPEVPYVFYNAKAQRHHYLFRGQQFGISKEDMKVLYADFKMKAPKQEKVLFSEFDPHDPCYIDLVDRTINYFEETEYMKIRKSNVLFDPTRDFPTIRNLISNLLPVEAERNHFINWFATIFNTRKKMRTSFVFKGAQGAGKNALFQHVIAPLLGKAQCRVVKNEDLVERFNPWIRQAFFIAFDEVAHDNKSRNGLNSKLKALITDDKVTLNDKNDKAFEIENRMNCVFFSNEAVPLVVEQSDRRFTIVRTGGNLAKQGFFDGDMFFGRIQGELVSFAQYLKNYPYNESVANTVLDTAEKQHLVSAAMDRFEEFAMKLKADDTDWMKSNLDSTTGFNMDPAPAVPDTFGGKFLRSDARRLFNAIYGDEVST
ncbi:MAG: hypothetical protein IH600_09385 [Bacteroidetes bacterium]|nr:hypothetical protein [Bacteroidota bacterium]